MFDLTALNGANGFYVEGLNANDNLGCSVSTAGDINGDGRLDLMLGARFVAPGGRTDAGTVYVIFGQTTSWPASFELTTLDGSNGFRVEGLNAGDCLGNYISTAGDMNGDGLFDLVLGAHKASPGGRTNAGAVYVIFGQNNGSWPASFNLTTLNGNNGFQVEGLNTGDSLGCSVSTAGDMNSDGLSDLVLGACFESPGGRTNAGTAYVIFGQASGWPASLNLTTLNGSNGFRVEGLNTGGNLGEAVSTAGDMNGDGLSDLVLGACFASPSGRTNAGVAYVIFGQTSSWPASFDLTTLNGSNGFRVEGVNAADNLGISVSTAGDMNGNSLSDLVLGASGASPDERTKAGTAYVIFGQTNSWPASFDLMTLNGSNGFRVEGVNAADSLGTTVSTAGDINGNGLSDLVLGAASASPSGRYRAGIAYVIFGQNNSSWPASFNLTTLSGSNGFRVEGLNSGDYLGNWVNSVGDFNGDSLSDLALGAQYASPGGRLEGGTAYVLFNMLMRPPQLIHNIPDQTVELEKPFSFQIASDTFSDPDGDVLKYSATQSDSTILPNWLNFDAATSFFFGTPSQTGITPITVTATDPYGLTARGDFNLAVQNQVSNSNIGGIIGGIVGGGIAVIGGLAGAAYLAYKRGFFASSDRSKQTATVSPDTEHRINEKTVTSLVG